MKNRTVDTQSIFIFAGSTGFITACIILGIPLYYGFAASVLLSTGILLRRGFAVKELTGMMTRGIRDCSLLFAVILLIGANISVWLSSGIVPSLIYYGFEYVKHINYLFACFAVTAAVSVVMGTAVGTVSTIGIALIGIGKGFGIPDEILLGTVISGAFIADRLSPISGLVNLTLKTTGLKYGDYLKSVLKTLIPSFIAAAAVYFVLGGRFAANIDASRLAGFQDAIRSAFLVSPFLLLLPAAIIALSVAGAKPMVNMGIGVLGGIVLCLTFQHRTLWDILTSIFSGYRSSTGIPELDGILKGGGIQPMTEVILIVAGAVALSSLLEGTNIINPIITAVVGKAKNTASLIARTAFFSILLTIATCDQTAGIILLGKLLQGKYEELKVDKVVLARTIADTGTTVAPLIPWNVNSIIILAITGVTTVQYAPYAALCYLSPIAAILAGLAFKRGAGMAALTRQL